MDLDITLRTGAWTVLYARCVLSCVEVSIIHHGGQSQVREALLSEARIVQVLQKRNSDNNNQDKADKMSLFSRKVSDVQDHIMHPRSYSVVAECS